jgi:predicted ester cyclase
MAMQESTQNRTGTGAQTGGQVDEALIRRMFGSFNEHDINKMMPFQAPDCSIVNVPLNRTYQGHSGFREFMDGWLTAFPDYKLDVTNIVCANDKCVVEFTARATHTGNLALPSGNVQPSNKRVELKFIDAYEFRGGLVTKSRTYYDPMSMMTQLGIMPKM